MKRVLIFGGAILLVGAIIASWVIFREHSSSSLVLKPNATSIGEHLTDKYLNKSNQELDDTYYKDFDKNAEWGGGGLTGLTGKSAIDEGDDPDGDGLTNEKEKELGTDPKNPDTDGDKVSDGVEVKNGTNPLDPESGGVKKSF